MPLLITITEIKVGSSKTFSRSLMKKLKVIKEFSNTALANWQQYPRASTTSRISTMPETDWHHPQIYNKMSETRVRSSIIIITFTMHSLVSVNIWEKKNGGARTSCDAKLAWHRILFFCQPVLLLNTKKLLWVDFSTPTTLRGLQLCMIQSLILRIPQGNGLPVSFPHLAITKKKKAGTSPIPNTFPNHLSQNSWGWREHLEVKGTICSNYPVQVETDKCSCPGPHVDDL